ncbi:MAG TPA: protein kinase family protein [Streptosporangiaceae bacterium]
MSTFTSEPGTRLGGRYRLEDRLAAAGGWSAWKAIDEILARPVSVITFAAGFPRLEQAVTAARAASRLTDTRLTQVFDVEDDWDHAYIVLEWPVGDTLTELVGTGPLEPLVGARIVSEVASALAGAHAAGLAHLCLRPDSVRWTTGGGVKVTGLGIDAALSGVATDDPALADTYGIGELLYAALTGLWPGPDYSGLPAAPHSDGQPRRPRQVRAGVPTALDDIAGRALALPGRDDLSPFTSPSQLASTLAGIIPPVQVPPAAASGRDARREADRMAGQREQARYQPSARQLGRGPAVGWQDDDRGREHDRDGSDYSNGGRGRRGNVAKLAALTLAVAVAVVGATAAVYLLRKPHHGSPSNHGSSPAGSPSTQVVSLSPQSAKGFDPLNLSDTGNENSDQAASVLTGTGGGWNTQYYASAEFGGLKAGVGLILDMGKSVLVKTLNVQFGSASGAIVKIMVGDSADRSPQTLNQMQTVAGPTSVSGAWTFTVSHPLSGRYLLIWFTRLPREPNPPSAHIPYFALIDRVSVSGIG